MHWGLPQTMAVCWRLVETTWPNRAPRKNIFPCVGRRTGERARHVSGTWKCLQAFYAKNHYCQRLVFLWTPNSKSYQWDQCWFHHESDGTKVECLCHSCCIQFHKLVRSHVIACEIRQAGDSGLWGVDHYAALWWCHTCRTTGVHGNTLGKLDITIQHDPFADDSLIKHVTGKWQTDRLTLSPHSNAETTVETGTSQDPRHLATFSTQLGDPRWENRTLHVILGFWAPESFLCLSISIVCCYSNRNIEP